MKFMNKRGDVIIKEIRYMVLIMDKIYTMCESSFENSKLNHIDLQSYLNRIYLYSECHKNCFIMALILIDRVMEEHSRRIKLPFSIHTLCLAALVVCIKLTEDDTALNNYYARLGGVTNQEMLDLEVDFLKLTNFKLLVSNDEIEQYKAALSSFTKA